MKEAVLEFSSENGFDEDVLNSFRAGRSLHHRRHQHADAYRKLSALREEWNKSASRRAPAFFIFRSRRAFTAKAVKHLAKPAGEPQNGFGGARLTKAIRLCLVRRKKFNQPFSPAGRIAFYRIDHYLGQRDVQNLLVFRSPRIFDRSGIDST